MKVDAWILERGPENEDFIPANLIRGVFDLGELGPEEIFVEPIYGCWEGNMGHAVNRKPIDICKARRENQVIIGNSGVVRVLQGNKNFPALQVGQLCLIYSGDIRSLTLYDYPMKAYAYDGLKSIGLLAKQTKVHYKQLIPIPDNSRFSLKHWAAFSLRYITAWGNWKVAHRSYRSMVSEVEEPHPYVWGWGGGTTLGILQLAKNSGYHAAMIASNMERLNLIKQTGLTAIDRREFINLNLRGTLEDKSSEEQARYLESEEKFLDIVYEKTSGRGVSIFVDLIGEPVYRATIKALARPSVLTTVGWKEGMNISYSRAVACMQWQTYVHTHYATLTDASQSVEYGEKNSWMPPLNDSERVYAWDEIGLLLEDYRGGKIKSYFPIYEINKL